MRTFLAGRKRARKVAATLEHLETSGVLNRVPENLQEPCEGPRKAGCTGRPEMNRPGSPALAAFLVSHGADTYYVCLACLVVLVVEHLEQLDALKREELSI